MKCSACGEAATQLGERNAPDASDKRRYFCDSPKCAPKDGGWTLYPLTKEERA